ncbi:MAG: phosphoenolpyruvate carboxylase [Gammaproteobacteria bacterium]|nr:MAG: phosphoenolpyruvate carboxylase [Gammaproteobacteria bacterium]
MTRESLTFEPKDDALRQDVGRLGSLVGELILEQSCQRVFDMVETVRKAAIHSRELEGASISGIPCALDPDHEAEFVRAFSTYFQAVNLAERVHRVRRRRDWLRQVEAPQPGSLEDVLASIAKQVHSHDDLQRILDGIRVEPVFTAHPTEPTRRTILRKQQRIARRLVELMDPSLTPDEDATAWGRIREELTSIWQTEEHPSQRMTVSDEFEHVLFFLTDVIYRVVPVFYENLQRALDSVFGELAKGLRIPVLIRFGSWVGGDMDGNPNVSAATISSTLAAQRDAILARYRSELLRLAEILTQCPSRVGIDLRVMELCASYGEMFPEVTADVPERHRNMPYRILARLLRARLKATLDGRAEGYASATEFVDDLEAIAASLRNHRGQHAGLFHTQRLIWRARTFGFHLATLDLRQDALVHRRVIGRALGDAGWEDAGPNDRAARLREELSGPAVPITRLDPEGETVLNVFRAAREARDKYGKDAIGPYIVSMARAADDVLSVLILARWAGLADDDGDVPLDVAPLFETLEDLESGADVLEGLLSDDLYGRHLARRGRRQIVMIGYSDSNKDAGIGAARWALHGAETSLAGCADRHEVDLTLFHGRGGTISRGGGKTHVAVMAAPPGAVRGVLRVTEQGEIINAKYGLRGVALRTLERAVGSVTLATFGPPQAPPEPNWGEAMDEIARTSAAAYRDLVYADPAFYGFFRQSTPIDVIERMKIGSRPASRRTGQGVQDLRAIPWVFAWSQNRAVLPGWYGFGAGLEAALRRHGSDLLREMFSDWLFMRALLEDVEMVLAKADMSIAARYASLADDGLHSFHELISARFERTVELVLELKGNASLLEDDPVLQRAVRLRNPYVDPMSLVQIDLLGRWRAAGSRDDELFQKLLLTVNGIAHGLQNTG